MSTYKILWVDDDINNPELRPDRDMLELKGCEITRINTVDEFLSVLDEEKPSVSYDCVIIDLSMPTGSLEISETKYGTRTGKVLLDRCMNSRLKESKIIIYTIVDAAEVLKFCDDNGIPYWSKADYTPREFSEKVINYIRN